MHCRINIKLENDMTTLLKEQTIRLSSRVSILLDPDDYDTPVIVSAKVGGEEYTSTYWAACDTGCVGNDDEIKLTNNELEALDRHYDYCSEYFDSVRSN